MNQEGKKAVLTLVATLVVVAALVSGLIFISPKAPEPSVQPVATAPTEPVSPPPQASATTTETKPATAADTTPATTTTETVLPKSITVNLLAYLPSDALMTAHFTGGDQLKPAYQASAIGQILADPQVQAFLNQPKEALKAALAKDPDLPDLELMEQIKQWVLRHQSAAAVYFDEHPGLVACVALGGDAVAARKTLASMIKNQTGFSTRAKGDQTIHVGPDGIEMAVVRETFVFATNSGKMNAVLELMNGAIVSTATPSTESVGQRIGWMNVNLPRMLALAREKVPAMCGSDKDSTAMMTKANAIISALGIDKMGAIDAMAGFDGPGLRMFAHVPLADRSRGIFRLYGNATPLGDALFRQIPQDVAKAAASRVDLAAMWDLAMEIGTLAAGQEMMDAKVMPMIASYEKQVGFKIKADLIDSIGDTFVTYSKPSLMPALPGETVVIVALKDPSKFAMCHENLVAMVNAMMAARSQPAPGEAPLNQPPAVTVKINKQDRNGLTVFSLTGMPISPSWCIRGDRLYVALSPQGLTAAMDQVDNPTASLLDNEDFKLARAKIPQAAFAFSYEDTRQSVAAVHGALQMMGPMLAQAAAGGKSPPIDFSKMPPLESIQSKVFGGLTIWSLNGTGFSMHQYSALGIDLSQMGGSMPIIAGMVLPALQTARAKARGIKNEDGQNAPPMVPQENNGLEVPTF